MSVRLTGALDLLDQKAKLAFEILARENSRMLTAYLRTLVDDESVVDDLFQESMLVAWRRLDECDLSRPFGPWLRGIAGRLILAHYRKRKALPVFLNEALLTHVGQQFESISTRPGDTWDEKVGAIRECIAALSESQRAVIEGRYFDELKTSALAKRLDISFEACKKRLIRARGLLAQCLARKGILTEVGT